MAGCGRCAVASAAPDSRKRTGVAKLKAGYTMPRRSRAFPRLMDESLVRSPLRPPACMRPLDQYSPAPVPQHRRVHGKERECSRQQDGSCWRKHAAYQERKPQRDPHGASSRHTHSELAKGEIACRRIGRRDVTPDHRVKSRRPAAGGRAVQPLDDPARQRNAGRTPP